MLRAKFIHSLKAKEPIVLTLVVSADNKRQTREYFTAFIDLVNRHKHLIKQLDIVLSFYLQRHYVGEQSASHLQDEWKEDNAHALDALEKNIAVNLIYWEALISKSEFKSAYKYITELYHESEEFRTMVDRVSARHAYKADSESAKAYLFEESAFNMTYTGTICYPANHLNAAIEFVREKFNKSLTFHGYFIHDVFAPKPKNFLSQSLHQLMRKFRIEDPIEQAICTQEVLGLMKRFAQKKVCDESMPL